MEELIAHEPSLIELPPYTMSSIALPFTSTLTRSPATPEEPVSVIVGFMLNRP